MIRVGWSVSRIIDKLDCVLYDIDNIPDDKEQFDWDVVDYWEQSIKDAIGALTNISYYAELLNDEINGR